MQKDGFVVEIRSRVANAILLHILDLETNTNYEMEYFGPYSGILEANQEMQFDRTYYMAMIAIVTELMEDEQDICARGRD